MHPIPPQNTRLEATPTAGELGGMKNKGAWEIVRSGRQDKGVRRRKKSEEINLQIQTKAKKQMRRRK